jgi:hypothetical protein
MTPFFEVVGNKHLKLQTCYHLLRACGISRPIYLMRGLPPEVTSSAMHTFDRTVAQTWLQEGSRMS